MARDRWPTTDSFLGNNISANIPSLGEPEDSEDEEANTGEDKCAGLYLYARFNSYYDSLLVEGSDLEDIHFKILENLGLFVDPFLRRNKHLWSIESNIQFFACFSKLMVDKALARQAPL